MLIEIINTMSTVSSSDFECSDTFKAEVDAEASAVKGGEGIGPLSGSKEETQ